MPRAIAAGRLTQIHNLGVRGCDPNSPLADGTYCVTSGSDGSLSVWKPSERLHLKRYEGHTSDVLACAPSHDNSRLVSAGADRLVACWDVATGHTVCRFRSHAGPIPFSLSCILSILSLIFFSFYKLNFGIILICPSSTSKSHLRPIAASIFHSDATSVVVLIPHRYHRWAQRGLVEGPSLPMLAKFSFLPLSIWAGDFPSWGMLTLAAWEGDPRIKLWSKEDGPRMISVEICQ